MGTDESIDEVESLPDNTAAIIHLLLIQSKGTFSVNTCLQQNRGNFPV